jgi:predicted nucleotidyltransferase
VRVPQVADTVAREFLDHYLDDIVEAYQPQHLVLSGSRASGRARSGSDVDLLIVAERFRAIKLPDRMGHFLNTIEPNRVVDVLCYTPEEFDKLRDGVGMVADICREGVWII